jgi:hypothetical protein
VTERIEFGPTPVSETCEQVGTNGYDPDKARRECHAYKGQLGRVLRRRFPVSSQRVTLRVVSTHHDFGTYYEVAALVDSHDNGAVTAAFWLEGNQPELWDAEAQQELGLNGQAVPA